MKKEGRKEGERFWAARRSELWPTTFDDSGSARKSPGLPARPSPAACLITLNFGGGGDSVGMEIGFASTRAAPQPPESPDLATFSNSCNVALCVHLVMYER